MVCVTSIRSASLRSLMGIPIRNEIVIRRADNGWVISAYSTVGMIYARMQGEKLRYTIHKEATSVIKDAKALMKLIDESLDEIPEQ